MKTCNKCDVEKPNKDFFVRSRNTGGYSHQCKVCEIAKCNEWRNANKDRVNASSRKRPRPPGQIRRHALWTLHRITPEAWDALLEEQGGRCASCKGADPAGKNWHIDHDHACCPGHKSCGKCTRGLLCGRCNVMLGMAQDNVAALAAGIEYLITYQALQNAIGAPG